MSIDYRKTEIELMFNCNCKCMKWLAMVVVFVVCLLKHWPRVGLHMAVFAESTFCSGRSCVGLCISPCENASAAYCAPQQPVPEGAGEAGDSAQPSGMHPSFYPATLQMRSSVLSGLQYMLLLIVRHSLLHGLHNWDWRHAHSLIMLTSFLLIFISIMYYTKYLSVV